MTEIILEKRALGALLRHLPRRSAAAAPAEVSLVDVGARGGELLAVCTDGLSEEIATGLYDDPWTIGWVLVMAAASDLAAAGGRPIGVATSLNLPREFGAARRARLGRGIGDACRSLGIVTLGGDVNVSRELTASATLLGLVPRRLPVSRWGARPGHRIYLSGPAGLGNAWALGRFDPARSPRKVVFRPRPPLELGRLVARSASSCIDTSDAVLAALDELARVNRVRFEITEDPVTFLHAAALEQCRCRNLPSWLALAGCHGEFELLFTLPPRAEALFLSRARRIGVRPLLIGRVRRGRGVTLPLAGRTVRLDTTRLRNRAFRAADDVPGYLEDLVAYAREIGA